MIYIFLLAPLNPEHFFILSSSSIPSLPFPSFPRLILYPACFFFGPSTYSAVFFSFSLPLSHAYYLPSSCPSTQHPPTYLPFPSLHSPSLPHSSIPAFLSFLVHPSHSACSSPFPPSSHLAFLPPFFHTCFSSLSSPHILHFTFPPQFLLATHTPYSSSPFSLPPCLLLPLHQ